MGWMRNKGKRKEREKKKNNEEKKEEKRENENISVKTLGRGMKRDLPTRYVLFPFEKDQKGIKRLGRKGNSSQLMVLSR